MNTQPAPDGWFSSLRSEIFDSLDPTEVANAIRDHGLYVWDRLVPGAVLDDLEAHLAAGPATPSGDFIDASELGSVPGPQAPTWWMHLPRAIECPRVQSLVSERNLVEAASRYLESDPLITSIVMWSTFARNRPDATSAQLFHYDADRSNFLKVFVYLTDVDETNGPHVYVPGSHHEKPMELLSGLRLDDRVVAKQYPRGTWETIVGPRGTVFFADTQGFHKGTQVLSMHRSILQFNFGTDRFGYEPFNPMSRSEACPVGLREVLTNNPRFLSQIYLDLRISG